MSVAVLHPDPGGTPAGWAALDAALDRVAAVDVEVLDDATLADGVAALAAAQSRLAAAQLALTAEADRRDVARRDAATGTVGWLATLTGDRKEVLAGGVWLAGLLRERYHHVRTALESGTIRLEQAKEIVRGLEPTASEVGEVRLGQAEALLIGKATGETVASGTPMSPGRLRAHARRIYRTIDDDIHRHHLETSLRERERRGLGDVWLRLRDLGDGRVRGDFTIPEAQAQMLRAVLENLTSPRRHGRDKAGRPTTDPTGSGHLAGLGLYDILGQGFCELIEHLPVDHLPRSAISLLVHVDVDALRGGLGLGLDDQGTGGSTGHAGHMDTGADLSAGDVRRMACEAGLIPVVLGTDSAVLDLGRTARLHTLKQRQALAVTHDTCAIAGCERPFAWTEIHHPESWADGGRTSVANGVPLCWPHHRHAHGSHFVLERVPDSHEWRFRRAPQPPRRQ